MSIDVRESGDESLLRLMSVGDDPAADWDERDVKQMLRHQMASALEASLALQPGHVARAWAEERLAGTPPETFLELLTHPTPSAGLLDLVRHFAKSNREHPDQPLRQIAGVIYRASILVARVRTSRQVSRRPRPRR